MSALYVVVSACMLLSMIPGFLTMPAQLQISRDGRRWSEQREMSPYYQNQMAQMQHRDNELAYAKKNQAMHTGGYEPNYKVSSKKASQDKMMYEIIEILKAILTGDKPPQGVTMSYYMDSD